jgi:hypothetical protein
VLGIVLYTLLVGASPSVLRAALMGGLSLFASQLGRRQFGLLSLALVVAGKGRLLPRPWNLCRVTPCCAPTKMAGSN